jgi:hypothetical protein
MTARQPAFLRWTETAEAAEVCASAALEPKPAASCRVESAGQTSADNRRPLWPRLVDWLARPGLKLTHDDER